MSEIVRWQTICLIAIFGLIGIFCRYFINVLVKNVIKTDNFWGTFVINLVGCSIIGMMQVLKVQNGISQDLAVGIMVGFLGGFTTFSGFCLDTLLLIEQKKKIKYVLAVLNLILQPSIGLALTITTVAITNSCYSITAF